MKFLILLKGDSIMLTASYEKMDGNYGRWAVVREIDDETLARAIDVFNDYKQRGIILNDNWHDNSWTLTDQVHNVGLTLINFEACFYKNAMNWIGCEYCCYQDCVKAYIAFNLGEIGLYSLREIANAFAALAGKTSEEAIEISKYINHVIGLLQIIPGGTEERDWVIESLEEKAECIWTHRKGNKRCLADFKSYLKFNEIISNFWDIANQKQKLFYFPLYFWWNLTAILPLRPTEFLLIPRDCLEMGDNKENILTVRRTKLKGGFEKIAYRIKDDYECKQYVITESLADELRSYLKSTENMRKTGIDTLFLQEPHYRYFGTSAKSTSKYYSYANLNACLRCFYQDLIFQKGIEIRKIRLGDTRHIAMVNLIISGGSPVVCRELAGHSDIDISSHYFSNISNLVECVTLERHRKMMVGKANIIGKSRFPIAVPKELYRLPNGWCSVDSVKNGDVGECLKVSSSSGEIGNCNYCTHYYPDQSGIRAEFLDEKTGKQKVDADSQYLIQMIEFVRKGIGYTEDIGTALLRLQRSSDHYSKCLWEKYSGGNL